MVSQLAGGSGVLQDVLKFYGDSANRLQAASDSAGWIRPELIGAGGDSFLPTLSREAQQAQQASLYANAANAARANDISAYSAQAQNRLGELNLLAGLRGPSNALKYNYMLNRVAPPAGTQAQGSYLPQLAPAGNPLSAFAPGATPGQIAAAAPKMQPNMGIPNTPAAVAAKPAQAPGAVNPTSGVVPQTGPGSGLPAYLLPQGDPYSQPAQDRWNQGINDGSINIQTQEEDVQAHQADLQEAAQQFQEEHGRAPENWETIAQEYENRGYDIPGFAMGTGGMMGGVRDPLALVGDERGGKPELLVNHGDGSFDILNNRTTERLIDSGMIEKMDMSQYKDGTRKISLRLGGKRKVRGYEDGTSSGRMTPIPGVSERFDWRYMDPARRQEFLQEMYQQMALGSGGVGGEMVANGMQGAGLGNGLVDSVRYAGAAKSGLDMLPGDTAKRVRRKGEQVLGRVARMGARRAEAPEQVPSYADGTGYLLEGMQPVSASQSRAMQSPAATYSAQGSGVRPYTAATSPEGALDNTVYDQQAIANLPAIKKLTGQMPSKSAWGTGLDMRIPGTDTALPGMLNTVNFMRQAPSEQALVQSIYETPAEMGGLGVDWSDIVAMSKRTTPIGSGLQTLASYGR